MEDYDENYNENEINEYDEADYEYKEEEEFQVGYVHFEQIGYEREEYEVIGTTMEGDMARLQQGILADDLGMFIVKLEETFNRYPSLFTEIDKKTIKKRASTLPFIKIRNPLYFCLGYYFFYNDTDKPIKKLVKEINRFLLIKYKRLWESIALYENRKMLEEKLKINYMTPSPPETNINI